MVTGSGCTNKKNFTSESDYLKWLGSEESRLGKIASVNGFTIKVKYMPPEYLAWLEMKPGAGAGAAGNPDGDPAIFLKTVERYRQSLTFLLTFEPDETKRPGRDVMLHNVSDYNDYKERFMELNFNIENSVSLHAGNAVYLPVLSSLENIYQLVPGRNMLLVFAPPSKEDAAFYSSTELDVVLEDGIFGTGIHHFVFNRNDFKFASGLHLAFTGSATEKKGVL